MWKLILSFVALALAACAKSSTLPLSADMVQIQTHAAPVCGADGAQRLALKQAAVETINRGYDKFVIVDGQYQAQERVVGYTPVVAQTTGSATAYGVGNTAYATGQSTTTYTGGMPMTATAHNQGVVVKMFKDNDPAGANALSARSTLGPGWQKISQEKAYTCFD